MPAKTEKKECLWSNNHRACRNTWAVLRTLHQLSALFEGAKDIKMSQLTFWNPTASPEERRVEARALATQIDRMFTFLMGARYEEGSSIAKAIEDITSAFMVADKTVCELAVTMDGIYLFWNETKS